MDHTSISAGERLASLAPELGAEDVGGDEAQDIAELLQGGVTTRAHVEASDGPHVDLRGRASRFPRPRLDEPARVTHLLGTEAIVHEGAVRRGTRHPERLRA